MPSHQRFERIAQDLEKLPCELHSEILIGLEFHQLIRLSENAGSRLEWSLKNSLAPWGIFFRAEYAEWQKLLAITDQVKKLCFKPPQKAGEEPDIFANGSLSFLHHRNTDWSLQTSYAARHRLTQPDALRQHWRNKLEFPFVRQRISAVHEKYKVANCDVAARKEMAELFEIVLLPDRLSTDDLAKSIELDYTLRLAVAEHLANDLDRLASLYEAHPTRLKTPFAPQTRRPNEKHTPIVLRQKARAIERRAKNCSWVRGRRQYHLRSRQTFPDLVPYDWCLQLFLEVLQSVDLSKSEYPKAMTDKCKTVVEEAPSWVVHASLDGNSETENKLVFCRSLSLSREDTQPSPARPAAELDWLEALVTVVAWMEGEFPALAAQVKGHDWDAKS